MAPVSNDSGEGTPPGSTARLTALLVLAAGSFLAMAGAAAVGFIIGNPVVVDSAVALWLAAGMLLGVAMAEQGRARLTELASGSSSEIAEQTHRRLVLVKGLVVAVAGLALVGIVFLGWPLHPPSLLAASAAAAAGIVGAGLAATAAHYFAALGATQSPESPGLARGARLLAWMLALATAAVGLQWLARSIVVEVLHFVALLGIGVVCFELSIARIPDRPGFPTNLRTFALFGSRAHPLGSALDLAEQQLGIDLRSTWALTVIRRTAEPLLIALLVVGWLATALTVVAPDEQGIVEHFGVPQQGAPLAPGLHLHWPWPIDRVALVPVRRIQTLHIGHSGKEKQGPEDVLWARQHAKEEYTFLLGNGRDLIAIGAGVQFRIADPYAWLYHDRNPMEALRAIAYRAVMRETVGRTLAGTLSENVAVLTSQMRSMMQAEADALGLGVRITSLTIGGMHPPVPVAAAYQAVVSAEIGKVTAVADARAMRNELVPKAEAQANSAESSARAAAAEMLGRGKGNAGAFRTLDAAYRASPEEYRFRRRLEALEARLAGRPYTVIDARIQRDGGELWLMK